MRTLPVEGGYAGWRHQALRALAAGWPPETLTWLDPSHVRPGHGGTASLFPDTSGVQEATVSGVAASGDAPPRLFISTALAALLQDAALYRSPLRWALLYRILWRWHRGDRSAALAADADGARLSAMAKAVRRAKHDMIAYVRFRRRPGPGSPEYVAWYEPDHDVLAHAAGHFARRMGRASWCIGTPQGAALWDGDALHHTGATVDPALLQDAAGDDVEPLWLVYYRNIFNPARLNESALQRQMPVRFWKGLPEGPLIPAMIAEARHGARRTGQASAVADKPGKTIAIHAEDARPRRDAPTTLDQCRRCELWRHATQAVPGCGPRSARIMLVGEQPGDMEDLSGLPFSGPAGRVLDQVLAQSGLDREALYLTNAVKHFKWEPRGKRRLHKTPAQREVEACAHWLDDERRHVRPAVIVALGATALRALLGPHALLRQHMTQATRHDASWILGTWHPSYALRAGDESREGIVDAIRHTLVRAKTLAGT